MRAGRATVAIDRAGRPISTGAMSISDRGTRKFVPEKDVDDLVTEGIRLVTEGTAPWDARQTSSSRRAGMQVSTSGLDHLDGQHASLDERT